MLVLVLWIAFGLVSMALYFAHAMTFELRTADNRHAAAEAEQAIAGAARYMSNILANLEVPGQLPDPLTYGCDAVPVGDATFWLIGRDETQVAEDRAVFGLVDEASKLNLNTATLEMLEWLPLMTPELAAAIVDWRDSDSDVSSGGAEDEIYLRLSPPYRCKNAPFETIEELRLVYGMDLELLYGEDANLNGILDPNEDDGDDSPPYDNRDGRLDPGLLEYVTVDSREPNTRSDGSARINVNGTNQTELASYLLETLGSDRANQILRQAGTTTTFRSLLEFSIRSGTTADELALVEAGLTVSPATLIAGLVNPNTASEAVLTCIPGIGYENAPAVLARRQSNTEQVNSIGWVTEVLDQEAAIAAGPYLSGQSYVFSADIAAVGHHGRGYQRVRFTFDTSEGTPKILRRRDLTSQGWALSRDVRESLRLAYANTR